MGRVHEAYRSHHAHAPVIPVLVIDDLAHALPVARALVKGGLRVLEVTLRTPAALEAITAMKAVEGAIVGAGTVTNPADSRARSTRARNSSSRPA
jgi:2-dehydro-3-deoxyphosphogluconate aldolase/(4S)-4-hydroxy-2-oxoglutarate aldolase